MEKETLEEVAKRLYEYQSENPPYTIITPKDKIEGFIEGAKWMQEQDKNKYSEHDMQEYATFCIRCYEQGLPCIIAQDWFKLCKINKI